MKAHEEKKLLDSKASTQQNEEVAEKQDKAVTNDTSDKREIHRICDEFKRP